MATHSENIEKLRSAIYGSEVRTAMIELFEDDFTLANIRIGTEITGANSSRVGYTDGSVYINIATLDVWKLVNQTWAKQGNLKGIANITFTNKTGDGEINTITFLLSDGTSKVFEVKNGSKGDTGVGIDDITQSVSTTSGADNPITVKMTDGTTKTLSVRNGEKGDVGQAAGFGTPTATVDANVGDPRVIISATGDDTAKVFNFEFHNLKGEKGDQGDTGDAGRSVNDIEMGTIGKVHPLTVYFSDGTSKILGNLTDGADGQGSGDMTKAVYDKNDNGIVDVAEAITDGVNTATYATIYGKADKATSLAGYGITDAYTKVQADKAITDQINNLNVSSVGGDGKVITAISESNGKINATTTDLKSDELVVKNGKIGLADSVTQKLSNFNNDGTLNPSGALYGIIGDVETLLASL